MDDNPSLSTEVKDRYKSMYSGIFYKRFILGQWVMAEGAIYDMWDDEVNVYTELLPGEYETMTRYIAVDYGTQNATVFLEILDDGHTLYVENEYYHSGAKTGRQKTDSEYAQDFINFVEGKTVFYTIVDPAAASFRLELRNKGVRVKEADNEVLDGIRLTGAMIGRRLLKINTRCKETLREVPSYTWDPKKSDKGVEMPIKRDDHACDALRYAVKTIVKPRLRFHD